MIKGIIFDADGTLLDSMQIWDDLGAKYLTSINKLPENELSKKLFSMTLDESCEYLNKTYQIEKNASEIKKEILEIIADFYKNEVMPKAGVREFIRKIQDLDIPMAIATSGDIKLLTYALERLDLLRFFKKIFTCSELQTSKLRPDIYNLATKALGSEARETVVFEDSLFALKTAKSAGFITVAVEDKSSINEKYEIRGTADFYISSFLDPDILHKLIPEKGGSAE